MKPLRSDAALVSPWEIMPRWLTNTTQSCFRISFKLWVGMIIVNTPPHKLMNSFVSPSIWSRSFWLKWDPFVSSCLMMLRVKMCFWILTGPEKHSTYLQSSSGKPAGFRPGSSNVGSSNKKPTVLLAQKTHRADQEPQALTGAPKSFRILGFGEGFPESGCTCTYPLSGKCLEKNDGQFAEPKDTQNPEIVGMMRRFLTSPLYRLHDALLDSW